ncbi:MAG: potassium channel protein [Desulfotalea sp.]|nr:MAG: potassium channel protein [Desulfotalea sp.]
MDYPKLRIALFLLIATIGFGTGGYVIFEGMPPFEAFYMTLITISTVGFSEVRPLSDIGRGITIIIIILGISLLTYTLGQVARIVVEGELRKILGRRKLEKQIAGLKGHYIICGYGRIGSIIADELLAAGFSIIVLDNDPERVASLEAANILYLCRDATLDETLVEAGLERAVGLITAVSSDANNVFISLSAKELRPDIFILARASDESNKSKLLRAGASKVVCPYQIGGKRMAEIIHKPTVIDFLEQVMMNEELDLQIEEAQINEGSPIEGATLVGSKLRQKYGVIIVAIKRKSGKMVFNPGPDETFLNGDVLVVIGKKPELLKMNVDIA